MIYIDMGSSLFRDSSKRAAAPNVPMATQCTK